MAQATAGTAARARCSRCSAAVRPGAPWCTQCYAPTVEAGPGAVRQQRPVPPAAAVHVPVARTAEAPRCAVGPVLPAGLPTGCWPCSSCAQANDLALAACAGCGTPFLAAVRVGPPTIVLPGVGDLLALSPARRTGLAVGVVVAVVLISALVALLLA